MPQQQPVDYDALAKSLGGTPSAQPEAEPVNPPAAGGLGMATRGQVLSALDPDKLAQRAVDALVNALPSIGGIALGTAAGTKALPTGVAASYLGGAGGEGFRQAIEAVRGNWENVPESIPDAVAGMMAQGSGQALGEVGGRAIGGAGRAIQRQASGVRLTDVQQFGDVGKTLADERIPVGPGLDRPGSPVRTRTMRRGSAIAAEKQSETARAVTAALERAKNAAVDGQQAVKAVDDLMGKTARGPSGMVERDMRRLSELRKGLQGEIVGGISPARAHELKTAYAQRARNIYAARKKGAPLSSGMQAEAEFSEAAANGLRRELYGKVEGYGPLERRQEALLGARRVVGRAEASSFARHGEFGLARNPVIGALIQAAADPVAWSRVGLLLNTMFMRQAPKAAVGAVQALSSER